MWVKQEEINATILPIEVTTYFDLLCIDRLPHVSHGEYQISRANMLVAGFLQLGGYFFLQLVTASACGSVLLTIHS